MTSWKNSNCIVELNWKLLMLKNPFWFSMVGKYVDGWTWIDRMKSGCSDWQHWKHLRSNFSILCSNMKFWLFKCYSLPLFLFMLIIGINILYQRYFFKSRALDKFFLKLVFMMKPMITSNYYFDKKNKAS